MEVSRRPLPGYMESVQNDVAPYMREILLDWLVEVAEEYKLVPDTLYLTASYIDRFLSYRAVGKNKIQLLGVSCMRKDMNLFCFIFSANSLRRFSFLKCSLLYGLMIQKV
jgi:hypothetical protein